MISNQFSFLAIDDKTFFFDAKNYIFINDFVIYYFEMSRNDILVKCPRK